PLVFGDPRHPSLPEAVTFRDHPSSRQARAVPPLCAASGISAPIHRGRRTGWSARLRRRHEKCAVIAKFGAIIKMVFVQVRRARDPPVKLTHPIHARIKANDVTDAGSRVVVRDLKNLLSAAAEEFESS